MEKKRLYRSSGKGEQWFKDINFLNKYRIQKYSKLKALLKKKIKKLEKINQIFSV